jgi:hypothetical protein
MIGRGVRRGEADVFIEVERGNLAIIEALQPMDADEFAVKRQRCGTRGKPENGVGLGADQLFHDAGAEFRSGEGAGLDDDFHRDDRGEGWLLCAQSF